MSGIIAKNIGRMGEEIVKNLLPKSRWINEAWDVCKFWDLEWKGLQIDVKTSTVKSKKGKAFDFGTRISNKKVIYVFVGLDGAKRYFWVSKGKTSNWKKTSESVSSIKKAIVKLFT